MRLPRAAAAALLCAACAHGPQKPAAPGAPAAADSNAIEVQDAVHGVKYQLPPDSDPWQVTREGTARSASGVEAEVSSFPLARDAAPATCRDRARSRLAPAKEPDAATATATDPPRDQSTAEAPVPSWSFTSGPAAAPVRNRWAFFARGADCLLLHVSGSKEDSFAGETFELAAKTFQPLTLPAERQREVDLLAGMGFLERRDPASALERFEALSKREPDLAKAHFGALMAGFELGPPAYGRALPHGEAALKAEHDLSGEQRQLALRSVGVMQLAENHVKGAAETLAELVVRAPELAEGQYNYACALARLGESQAAIEHLRAAVRLDADMAVHAKDDEDLKSLREAPGFQEIVTPPTAVK